ncbi:MAG: FAD-dependent oxidoreductase [Candidatus Margulisiibacteriota bacterium]
MRISDLKGLEKVKQSGLKSIFPGKPRITVGMDTCGIGNGAKEVMIELEKTAKKNKLDVFIEKTGCFGFCAAEPLVNIHIPGLPLVILKEVKAKDAGKIIKAIKKKDFSGLNVLCKIESWDHITGEIKYGSGLDTIPVWNGIDFFKFQKKIVLRDCGLINPEDIEEYIAVGGYFPLFKVLNNISPENVIEEVKKSKLRGRGGAGFPTAIKWTLMRQEKSEDKYVVCNADEGDPGAYMNRNEIESDPHMLIEGMVIAAYAMGANKGVIYVRAEYPLAVERLVKSIAQARQYGVLGDNILGSKFSFDINLVEGAGAFVCGEETALIASIEGFAGRPTQRPPFPAQKGIFGKPTNINNVETFCNVPAIISKGADWFMGTGTKNSPGTKVFSLVGKIKNTGLVEMPLGQPLQTVIYNIGGGTGTKKKIKAVQTGGPSGGCIPTHLFNTPLDYESLNSLGTIMGSGGIVVMDDDNCMVDVAKYFTEFTNHDSCGKCTPCREGLYHQLKILEKVCAGKAVDKDISLLKDVGAVIADTALCGLGQTAPNPVMTTLRYFPLEYEHHIKGHRCPSGVCLDLLISPCENSCPLHINIPGYIELFREGRLQESFELILQENFLPSTTGRICHFHCKMRCRREDIDKPVAQGELHRFIADKVYKNGLEKGVYAQILKNKFKSTGKKVGIVGAGPAGLTAAYYLSRLGHDVTVFDAKQKAGGILRYGIPSYRLPKDIMDKELGILKKLGVKFKFGNRLDSEKMKKVAGSYDAVFTATGAYKEMPFEIKGSGLKGVWSGVDFLDKLASGEKIRTGKNIVIVGAGNVAIDACRSARRLGAKVTILYRRGKDDMPANSQEIEESYNEGIGFIFYASPEEIVGDEKGTVSKIIARKMAQGDFDISGRRKPVATDEMIEIPCDTIMFAIGEKVDARYLDGTGVALNRDGTAKTDIFTFVTDNPKIFAGGDLVTGPGTAVEAMGQGKAAAKSIDKFLTGLDRWNSLYKKIEYKNIADINTYSGKPQNDKKIPVTARKNNFNEVSYGLDAKQAQCESLRCLRCDIK